MGTKDPRVDAYIAKSADFAQPILHRLRAIVHEVCPEVEEQMKWSFPNFLYKGMFANMAAFKEHCSFGFWKSSLVLDAADSKSADGMGQFGRLTSLKHLPPKRVLVAYIRKAMQLNEDGVKAARKKPAAEKKELEVPEYLASALRKNKPARTHFEGFSYSKKKDYIDWLTEAKTEATRTKRLATALEWMADGKSRNWKYENC